MELRSIPSSRRLDTPDATSAHRILPPNERDIVAGESTSVGEMNTIDEMRHFAPGVVAVAEAPQARAAQHRVLVVVLLVSCNLVLMAFSCIGIGGGMAIAQAMGDDLGPGKSNWIAASFGCVSLLGISTDDESLTQGAFVLVSGRLGAICGHKRVAVAGGVWFVLCGILTGFCSDFIAFNVMRALCGIGGAFLMPNSAALISTSIPPGRQRNVSLGFFGASAPLGGYLGFLAIGLFMQYGRWNWTFFALGALAAVVVALLAWLVPNDAPVDPRGRIDFVGAALGTAGLILFNVVWTEAPVSGWQTPYQGTLLGVSILLIFAFLVWELKGTSAPIMPLDIWTAPSFGAVVLVSLGSYMAFGILQWYILAWEQVIWGWSPLQFALGFSPFIPTAIAGALLCAWLIPRMVAQGILAIGAGTVAVSSIIVATMPVHQTYWAGVFPATIIMSFCSDFVYTASQIIASNAVRRNQQGVAASMMAVVFYFGNSVGIGFAGTIEAEVDDYLITSTDPAQGYRAALWFGAALGGIAIGLDLLFVRMAKDDREGWQDPEDLDGHSAEIAEAIAVTGRQLDA